jgi:hypothetical protein
MIRLISEVLIFFPLVSLLSFKLGMEIGHLISNYLEWVEDDKID